MGDVSEVGGTQIYSSSWASAGLWASAGSWEAAEALA
jgi:hypothetical protein